MSVAGQGKVGLHSLTRNREYTVSREKNDTGILQLYKGSWDYAVGFLLGGERKDEKKENRKEEESRIDGKIDGKKMRK